MLTLGQLVPLEAKPGKEEEAAAFLRQAYELATKEATTPLWFAVRSGKRKFAVFDAFHDEAGRQAHLNGPIAQALMAQAPTLFTAMPEIQPLDVIGAKVP
jgi:quinol monooxygenase YgiN